MRSRTLYVLDATATVHMAKIQKLDLVLPIGEVYITREVYKETVERGEGRPDAIAIQDAIENGDLRVYDIRNRELTEGLSEAS